MPLLGTDFALRPISEGDLNYVRSTWMRSYRRSVEGRAYINPLDRKMADQWYYDRMRPLVEHYIRESDVMLAVDPSMPTSIAGWICSSGSQLHYVYVIKDLRRMGLAKEMMASQLGAPHDKVGCSFFWPFRSLRYVFAIPARLEPSH